MTCRDEILKIADRLALESATGEFSLESLVARMMQQGTEYSESTIRTHVTSRMCANSPDHHAVTYPDLERTGRGLYRLIGNGDS